MPCGHGGAHNSASRFSRAAIGGVELTLVEAYANQEAADVALCEQRLDELNVELDRLIPRQRRSES